MSRWPCVRAGLFLLLLLLFHLFYTSFCFIRLPLTGSDYPQSLNPVREASCLAWKCQLAIYSSSSSLSLSQTHHEANLSVYGWRCWHVTCFMRVCTEAALVILGDLQEKCVWVSEIIVNHATYCGSWAGLQLCVKMILHPKSNFRVSKIRPLWAWKPACKKSAVGSVMEGNDCVSDLVSRIGRLTLCHWNAFKLSF